MMSKLSGDVAAGIGRNLGIHVMQGPKGNWFFVGTVPAALMYEGTPEQLDNARQFGPTLARVERRVFSTKDEAMEALNAYEQAAK